MTLDYEEEAEPLTEREAAAKAASLIAEGFDWDDTQDGHNYWSEVYRRLRRIATSEAEPGEKL